MVSTRLLLLGGCVLFNVVIAYGSSHPATAAPPPLIFPKDYEKVDAAVNVQPTSTVVNLRAEELPPFHFPKLNSQKRYTVDINKTDAKLPPMIFPNPKFIAKALDEKKDKVNMSSLDSKKKYGPKIATEVTDLLKGGENATVYEDTTETPMENDTVIVEGPNVKDPGTTHEEEAKSMNTSKSNSSSANDETHSEASASPSSLEILGENTSSPVAVTEAKISHAAEILPESSNETVTTDITPKASDNNTKPVSNITSNTTFEQMPNVENVTDTEVSLNETVSVTKKNESKEKTDDDNRTQKQTEEDKVKVASSTPDSITYAENSTATVNAGDNLQLTTLKAATKVGAESSGEENSVDQKTSHEKPMAMASQQHSEHSHPAAGKSSAFLQPTESAAILAGVFVAVALLGYVGLLVWRRILEKRYGNREMLVNEEDFYDTNDLKNFEL